MMPAGNRWISTEELEMRLNSMLKLFLRRPPSVSLNSIFITGSSGVGKTPLVAILQSVLPSSFDVHDLDERLGGADRSRDNWADDWRKAATRYFMDTAARNAKENKSTVVCGLTWPHEVIASANIDVAPPIKFCFLDASHEVLRQRLYQRRFSNAEKIAALKAATGLSPEEFIEKNKKEVELLKKECLEYGAKIIDTDNFSSEELARVIMVWLEGVI